jgi:hypothetical protein
VQSSTPSPQVDEGGVYSDLVDISKNIYAGYVAIDGTSYVTTISNTITPQTPDLIFESSRKLHASHVHFAFDHLGVRWVHFDSFSQSSLQHGQIGQEEDGVLPVRLDNIKSKDGIWWKRLFWPERLDQEHSLCVLTDVE